MSIPKSRIALVVLGVLWVLVIGFLAVLAHGVVPNTLRQFLLVVFILGPFLLFAEAIIEFLFQVVCYGIAKVFLPVLTFGWLRVEPLGKMQSFPWYGITRSQNGKFEASTEAGSIIGLLLVVVVCVLGFYLYAQ